LKLTDRIGETVSRLVSSGPTSGKAGALFGCGKDPHLLCLKAIPPLEERLIPRQYTLLDDTNSEDRGEYL
jgi:hypothetical protein